MCGIAGIYNSSGNIIEPVPLLKRMLSRIQYRGPDESGIYFNNFLAFGSVRLSIIDVENGQQPFSSACGKYWIVFNGEIFNFPELKSELEQKGYHFRTKSDTEVLLNAYIEYGTSCMNLLNGQFAFAIWNDVKKELFLARDRVGIRPLFYSWCNNSFIFGSEIKTIFEFPQITPEIDNVSLSQIFTLWTPIPPRTIFKNIRELPPGHFMFIKNSQSVIQSYWNITFPFTDSQLFKGTIEEASVELERILTSAVQIRLRADVPVAAYLSGGLDSSTITALIKGISPSKLQTFSIGFNESEFDETIYQRQVSDFLNTSHKAFLCSSNDIGTFFPSVVWHSEIPILRTAPVPMYILSKKVRENKIKVVLTGEGADEMVGGYDIFKEAMIREFWSKQPDSRLRPLLFNKLYPYLAQFQSKNKAALKLFFGYKLTEIDSPYYSHLLRWHNTSGLQKYFSDDFLESITNYDVLNDLTGILPEHFNDYSRLSKAQWLEIVLFMSGYLLSSQGDRMAMAHSVEGRYPFLDYRLVEFTSTLPSHYKLSGLNEKYILKKIMAGKIPGNILKRPKQAYRAPMASGFYSLEGKLYSLNLTDKREIIRLGIFNEKVVTSLMTKTQSGAMVTETENMALSGIISTQLLIHQYILRDSFRPPLESLNNCRIINDVLN